MCGIAGVYSLSGQPVPNLGQTVSPQLTVGYRFERGNALLASYRYLGSSGDNNSPWSTAHGRLNSHWLRWHGPDGPAHQRPHDPISGASRRRCDHPVEDRHGRCDCRIAGHFRRGASLRRHPADRHR